MNLYKEVNDTFACTQPLIRSPHFLSLFIDFSFVFAREKLKWQQAMKGYWLLIYGFALSICTHINGTDDLISRRCVGKPVDVKRPTQRDRMPVFVQLPSAHGAFRLSLRKLGLLSPNKHQVQLPLKAESLCSVLASPAI
ncbi:hypothetical protein XENORESO_020616 [Xenotaenia resolanae]|uniref:Uncharacterized protein n=1 Tax=Xenotaenia resolanae TaxID=208358 RepID=A0ABV0WCY5_9TELE